MEKIIIGDNKIQKMQTDLGSIIWSEFMQNDKIANKYWDSLYTNFSDYQFAVLDDAKLLGIGNSIPLYWNQSVEKLPTEGLDWAMEKANADFKKKLVPNTLVGIQILINPEYQGHGLSYKMIEIMKKIAFSKNIDNIALPVRPTLKSKYPLISMNDYIHWKNKDGLPFDSWIRVHIKAGGKIVGICSKSMQISGTIAEWESWTNLKIQTSGEYIVDKALAPVRMDIEKDIGKYIEPNVWIVYSK